MEYFTNLKAIAISFLKEYQLEHKTQFSTQKIIWSIHHFITFSADPDTLLWAILAAYWICKQLVFAVYMHCYEHCLCIMLFIYSSINVQTCGGQLLHVLAGQSNFFSESAQCTSCNNKGCEKTKQIFFFGIFS